jgi:signal transduction histidine kinase
MNEWVFMLHYALNVFFANTSNATICSSNYADEFTELLSDSKLEDSERALCETIQGCGQTLLNTVSHILDYTKVNDFNGRMSEQKREREFSPTGRSGPPEEKLSSIALFSDVDVALICESAIQSVCVGNAFDRRMSEVHVPQDAASASATAIYSLPNSNGNSSQQSSIAVILYISPGHWSFHCAPGAIQRILMNLVGNSLKYTKAGHIKVKLEGQTELQGQPGYKGHSQVTITVSDTGIGISKDFLRYKLFTPFSQESAVAAGTGE